MDSAFVGVLFFGRIYHFLPGYNQAWSFEDNSMANSIWRLIESDALQGPMNMAIDEALLESVGAGRSLPVLRLYRWSPPCISIGYAQNGADVDHLTLNEHGWDWVRRPTGGRAILHTDELTYSVIAPPDEPRVAGSLLESYRRILSGFTARSSTS